MSSEYLSCKQAAQILDVSPSTIKRLCDEKRLTSLRTPGGHRRISLQSVRRCQGELNRCGSLDVIAKRDANLSFDYHDCAELLIRSDDREFRRVFERSPQKMTATELCDHSLAPALVHLGSLHVQGRLGAHSLVIACQRLRSFLSWLLEELPAASHDAQCAVGAQVDGDTSDIGSLMVEVAMREAGWRAYSLGTGCSGESLGRAATELNASIVWVSYIHHQPLEKLIEHNRALCENMPPGCRLVIGGGGLTTQVRRMLSFNLFADSLVQLRSLVEREGPMIAA